MIGDNGVVCEVEVKKDFHRGNIEKIWTKINHSCFTTAYLVQNQNHEGALTCSVNLSSNWVRLDYLDIL